MLSILTPPAAEPVSVVEAKRHLRLETSSEDAFVERLVTAARRVVEERTGRALVSQTARLTLDRAPERAVTFPRAPLNAVLEVAVLTDASSWTPVSTDLYAIETGEGARVVATGFWPRAVQPVAGVRIDAEVGYGPRGAAPADLQQAVLLLVAHFFERREPAIDGRAAVLPHSIEALLASYRRPRL